MKEDKINAGIAQRTAAFDRELVQRARQLGVNPDNFESETALQSGIDQMLLAQDKEAADDDRIEKGDN